MDLNRLTNESKLELCKSYFKGGCLLLPFLWAANAIWFFKDAFVKPPFEEQKEMKKYVLLSGIGASVWAALLGAWVTVFQLQRASWGETGEALSFIMPLGGCLLLPIVLAVMAIWSFSSIKPTHKDEDEMKKCLLISGIGAAVWAAILATWVIIFQIHNSSWGATDDTIISA